MFTAADLNPDVEEQWHTSIGPGSPETPRPPLAEDEVRFVGDPIALVVAESLYLAEDAAELVEVDYEPLTPVVDYRTAEAAAELVHEAHGSNLITELGGLPASALEDVYASAAHVTRATIAQQAYVPVPMEGRGLVVDYSPSTGDLTIHSATQSPHEVRLFCSRLLGIPEHRIRVVMRDTGGGFGQKILVQRDEMCLMLAGRKLGAPVKWVEDRRENLIAAGKSRQEHADVSVAFDADGVIQAVGVDFMSDCGAYPTPWPMMSAAAVGALFPGPYRVPEGQLRDEDRVHEHRRAHRLPRSLAVRDVGPRDAPRPRGRESGIDPAELRRRNLLRAEDLPYTSPNGMTYDSISPLETFEHALDMLDYDGFRAEQAAARAEGRYLGVGLSNYVEPSTPGFGYYATEGATIRIEPSGAVNVYIAGGSTGNSIETTVVQLTADALGVDIDQVATIQGDTALTGFGAGAAGSRSGSMTAGAIEETAAILRERLVAVAAHKLEAAPDDIELGGSRASVRGTPDVGVSFKTLARMAYFEPQSLPPGVPAGLEASARYTTRHRFDLRERHARVHVRGRRRHRQGHAAALHRQRGLRPDDQPQRGRGPDRGRHRAGHRRRAPGAPRVRRRRQPGHHHLDGLPDADRVGRADARVRARRDAESRARWLQGRGGGRRHRRAAGGGERGGRRARALRRAASPTCRSPRRRSSHYFIRNRPTEGEPWESSTARSR